MSYLRFGSVYKYVEGYSNDYIFPGGYIDKETGKEVRYIEDYDHISSSSVVELVARNLETDFPEFKEYLIKKLAEKLSVKLRDKPLTNEEAFDETIKRYKDEEQSKDAAV